MFALRLSSRNNSTNFHLNAKLFSLFKKNKPPLKEDEYPSFVHSFDTAMEYVKVNG